ncbi:MAG: hypothetical protein LBF22_13115 [Deltaproteobacteria bacterium]|nr:hypothetical protein [Deltaproteobacteria bacterium]
MENNPFYILKVTQHDGREEIAEIEELSNSEIDLSTWNNAKTSLLKPANRVSAEVAWFPGTTREEIKLILDSFKSDFIDQILLNKLNSICKANLLSYHLRKTWNSKHLNLIPQNIVDIIKAANSINDVYVHNHINKDRDNSRFSKVVNLNQVKEKIDEQKKEYIENIKFVLNQFDSADTVEMIKQIIMLASLDRETINSIIIYELIEYYKLHTYEFFVSETENIKILINQLKDDVKTTMDQKSFKTIDLIGELLEEWHYIDCPIQLYYKAKNLTYENELSIKIINEIRQSSIFIHNAYNKITFSISLTEKILKAFSDVPSICTQVNKELKALNKSLKFINNNPGQNNWNTNKSENSINTRYYEIDEDIDELINHANTEKKVFFEFSQGFIIKDTFKIDTFAIHWKGERIKCEDVKSFRWIYVQHVWYGGHFKIFLKLNYGQRVIDITDVDNFQKTLDCIWKTIGVRLCLKYFNLLRKGQSLKAKNVIFFDDHVEFLKNRIFIGPKHHICSWEDLQVRRNNNILNIYSRKDVSFRASFNNFFDNNVLVIEGVLNLIKNSRQESVSQITFQNNHNF